MPSLAISLAVVAALLGAPEGGSSTLPASETPQRTQFLIVDVVGLDRAAFVEELQLRLPQRTLLAVRSPRPSGPVALIHVSRVSSAMRITLVQPDGRAFDRTLEHEPDQAARVGASAAAILLVSVEAGTIAPDRTDATIPGELPPAESEPAVAPPVQDTVPRVDPPTLELGVTLGPGVALGVAPLAGTGVLVGGGGTVDVALRHRSGGLASVFARGLHRTNAGLSATRLRVGVGAGYGWRWRAVELLVAGRFAVEPWWIRADRSAAPLTFQGAPTRRRPLLGAGALASVGYFGRAPQHPNVAWRVGPHLEVGGAFVVHRGARTVRVDAVDDRGDATPAVRLGGLELDAGVDVTVWFGVLR